MYCHWSAGFWRRWWR